MGKFDKAAPTAADALKALQSTGLDPVQLMELLANGSAPAKKAKSKHQPVVSAECLSVGDRGQVVFGKGSISRNVDKKLYPLELEAIISAAKVIEEFCAKNSAELRSKNRYYSSK